MPEIPDDTRMATLYRAVSEDGRLVSAFSQFAHRDVLATCYLMADMMAATLAVLSRDEAQSHAQVCADHLLKRTAESWENIRD